MGNGAGSSVSGSGPGLRGDDPPRSMGNGSGVGSPRLPEGNVRPRPGVSTERLELLGSRMLRGCAGTGAVGSVGKGTGGVSATGVLGSRIAGSVAPESCGNGSGVAAAAAGISTRGRVGGAVGFRGLGRGSD